MTPSTSSKPFRKSIRLPDYDYSQPGAYFVTICVQDQRCLFGHILKGIIQLNDAGRMVGGSWNKLSERFPGIKLDEYVIMPNHFHGIVHIVGAPLVGARIENGNTHSRAGTSPAPTLGQIVGAFKSITTKKYMEGVRQFGWKSFHPKLWHRNYYEHIIRSESKLNQIRQYIQNNPAQWDRDEYNPGILSGNTIDRVNGPTL